MVLSLGDVLGRPFLALPESDVRGAFHAYISVGAGSHPGTNKLLTPRD